MTQNEGGEDKVAGGLVDSYSLASERVESTHQTSQGDSGIVRRRIPNPDRFVAVRLVTEYLQGLGESNARTRDLRYPFQPQALGLAPRAAKFPHGLATVATQVMTKHERPFSRKQTRRAVPFAFAQLRRTAASPLRIYKSFVD